MRYANITKFYVVFCVYTFFFTNYDLGTLQIPILDFPDMPLFFLIYISHYILLEIYYYVQFF